MRFRKEAVQMLALLVVLALVAVGCATIMKGSDQEVRINSSPAGAKVTIKTVGGVTVYEGTTPVKTKIPKKNQYVVTVSMQGYKDATANITQESIEGWFWGNILCGGIIGIIVDATNGAMHHLGPEEVMVSLSTAYLDGNQKVLYAVFQALDSQGQLRSLAVPLMENEKVAAQ